MVAGCCANTSCAAASSRPQRRRRNGFRNRTSRLIIVKGKLVVLCFEGHLRAVEVKHCSPLSLTLGAPHDLAAQQTRDHLGRKIVVKVEKAGIEGLVTASQAEGQVGRIVFGGEDEADRERIA